MDKDSLNHSYKKVYKYLDNSLVNKAFSNSILKLTELLPPAPISGIECRMQDTRNQIDFSILLWPDQKYLQPLIGISWNEEKSDSVYWAHIYSLCQSILDPDSFLYSITKSVALEFDLNEGDNSFADPLFFLLLKPLPKLEQVRSSILLKLIDEIPNSFSRKTKFNMARCAELVRFDQNIYAIGWMPSRDNNIIRYGIEVHFFEEIVSYLQEIEWTGDLDQFIQTFSPFTEYFNDLLVIGFDISETIGKRIGVEFRIEAYDRKSRLLEFLQLCIDLNLASKRKCDSIMNWEFGGSKEKDSIEDNSKNIHQSMEKGIAYFKFIYFPGKPLELKTYLFFRERSIA